MSTETQQAKSIERDELSKYIFNPELVQKKILDLIDTANGQNVMVTNATSPFNMLLEATAVTTANATNEMLSITKSKYPSLAFTKRDITHHISDDEFIGLFSSPGDVKVEVYVSVTDLISNGYRPPNAKYIEYTIPEKTVVTVYKTDLTMLNDVVVKYYDNDTSFVEMLPSENPLALKDIGVLPSIIFTDKDNNKYIYFEVPIKQLSLQDTNYPTIASEGFTKILPLKDKSSKYHHIRVGYSNKNGEINYLKIGYNDEYLDPYVPTAYITMVDNPDQASEVRQAVRVHIPNTYFISNMVTGTIFVSLYETQGDIYTPLADARFEDFEFKLGLTGKNSSTAVSPNIRCLVKSRETIINGTSGMSFDQIKKAIIYNTTGTGNLPITDYQLAFANQLEGFEIFKDKDIITGRSYAALRNLNKTPSKEIRALQDVYFNTVNIILERYLNNKNISIFEDSFIIKSNAVFKTKNSVTELVNQEELNNLKLLSKLEMIDHYKDTKYFYTPYYYVISRFKNITTSRVYDLDRPRVVSNVIAESNRELDLVANIHNYKLYKSTNGYELVVTIKKNKNVEELDPNNIHTVLALDLITGNQLWINGTYNTERDCYIFKIDSDMYVDENDNIHVTNGRATTNSNFMPLQFNCNLYIYTDDVSVTSTSSYLSDVIYGKNDSYVVIARQYMVMELGHRLNYIWNNIALSYTERKYKRYTEDIPAYYEDDVLEPNETTGWSVTVQDDKIMLAVLHKKGDPVLDESGTQILLHKAGEVILENGSPVIDDIGGMVRHIDICMLDYEFALSDHTAYKKYNQLCLEQLDQYLLRVLPNNAKGMLENTTIAYKSYKSMLPIKTKINNVVYGLSPLVSPKVTIYYGQNSEFKLTSTELESIRDRIGYIFDQYLENPYIKLAELRDRIQAELGENVVSVKITNLDPYNSELINFVDTSTRMSMKKLLVLNDYNQLEVKYDVDINIQTL